MNLRPSLFVAAALLLSACASEPPPAPPPAKPAKNTGYIGSADARPTAEAPASRRLPAGHMRIDVTKADLSTQVLPLFEQQVGITIIWQGDPRLVTLRLTQSIAWDEALSLVCQFTKTHATRDYQNRLILKDGWGGELGDGDISALQGQGAANVSSRGGQRGGRSSGAAAGSNPGWSDGRAQPASGGGGNGIPQPTGAYAGGDEAGRLLRGANTRTSNAGPQ